MRNIFRKPRQATETELQFIQLMEHTHDSKGYSTETLCVLLDVKPRTIRTMMELWNNFKYSNIIPTFKISKLKSNILGSKHLYRRIDMNSKHRDLMLLKAKLDKIEYIIKEYNTRKILGSVNTLNQKDIEFYLSQAEELQNQIKELGNG